MAETTRDKAGTRDYDENEPFITLSALRSLADESQKCGAYRYAEAYRIVANRLEEIAKEANRG